jgi:hypothetical protein
MRITVDMSETICEPDAQDKRDYLQVPGLKLTAAQAARFWHLGVEESKALLESLAANGALARTADGYYIFSNYSHS